VNGRNLFNASSITFEPAAGIGVGSNLTVSADGTLASVSITIDSSAAIGKRAVTITTPGGTTSATLGVGNSFKLVPVGGPFDTYTPIVSRQVGVLVSSALPATQADRTYTPLTALPVGIAVGTVITGIEPASGAIGTNDLRLRFTGRNLAGVNELLFNPADGITITPGSFTIAADGSYAEALVSIAASAPQTSRVAILKTATGRALPARPGADVFRVTLPQPEVYGISPIRREKGSSFTLSISGKLLSGATQVVFVPADGITVVNPPTVSADGTLATVSVNISATASASQRVVTITTPGGTTTDTPSAANSFTVTDLAGTTYTPILSAPVGILVTPPPPAAKPDVGYGPVISGTIGVLVPPPPPPAKPPVQYGAILSPPVGITVGSVVQAMAPTRMEPGTTVTVTFTGVGLGQVTSLKVMPATGITVGTITPSIDGTGLTAQITADAAAPRAVRTITLFTAVGPVSVPAPSGNLFYVGYRPAISSITPILQTVGNSFTLTINGTNLDGATTVRFESPDGITVVNPPTVNAAGTQATVTVIIDGMAAGNQRVVVIEGPYGTSDNTPGANNIFTVSRPFVQAPAASMLAGEPAPASFAEAVAGWPGALGMLALADRIMPAVPVWRQPVAPPLADLRPVGGGDDSENDQQRPVRIDDRSPLLMVAMTTRGYRGPPERIG